MHSIKILFLVIFILLPSFAAAAALTDIHFIKIAAQDAKAVIKGADGKLVVIKPGDTVAEGVQVKEITTGRIVLEQRTDQGVETVFVRMTNGKQVIERVRKTPEKSSLMAAPPETQR